MTPGKQAAVPAHGTEAHGGGERGHMQIWAAEGPLRGGPGSAEPGSPRGKPGLSPARLADRATPKAAPAPGQGSRGEAGQCP